jgi:N-ethylmaleimide reductase
LRTGNDLVRDGFADVVAFGAPFISNPDSVERFSDDLKLKPGEGDEGDHRPSKR